MAQLSNTSSNSNFTSIGTRAATNTILHMQSSLQEETLRLASACSDLEAVSSGRQQELAELSEILERVRATHAKGGAQDAATPGTLHGALQGQLPAAALLASTRVSPGGRSAVPRAVDSGLGALTSANSVLSQFHTEMESSRSKLASYASEARGTASAVKEHMGKLQQLLSPAASPAPTAAGAAADLPRVRTPTSETASLLQLLQEAAQQRALAESSLRTPSPRAADAAAGASLERAHDLLRQLLSGDGTLEDLLGASPRLRSSSPAKKSAASTPREPQQPSGGGAADRRYAVNVTDHGDVAGGPSFVDQTEKMQQLQQTISMLQAERAAAQSNLDSTLLKAEAASQELAGLQHRAQQVAQQVQSKSASLEQLAARQQLEEQRREALLVQLQQMQSLLQASAQELEEVRQHIADARATSAANGNDEAPDPDEGEQPEAAAGVRTKLRAKRHTARRAMSCGNLAEGGSSAPPSSPQSDGKGGTGHQTSAESSIEHAGCSSCARHLQQAAALQQQLDAMTLLHSKVCLQLEQERHAGLAQQMELVALRQKLRAHTASAAGSSHDLSARGSGSAGVKRPLQDGPATPRSTSLSVSADALDDLLEEASADLEQLEAHVAGATQRLLELQAQNVALAQDAEASVKAKMQAEEHARHEAQRVEAMRDAASRLRHDVLAKEREASSLNDQLQRTREELHKLHQQVSEQQQQAQQARATLQATEEQLQAMQQAVIQAKSQREEAQQACRALEHQLEVLQPEVEEAERRIAQAGQAEAASRREVEALETQCVTMRSQNSTLESQIEAQQAKQARVREELSQLQAQLDTTREAAARREQEASALQAQCTRLQDEVAGRQQELQQLQARTEERKQQHAQEEAALGTTREELQQLQSSLQELQSVVERQEQQASAAERRQASARQELDALQSQLEAAQKQLADMHAQLAATGLQLLHGGHAYVQVATPTAPGSMLGGFQGPGRHPSLMPASAAPLLPPTMSASHHHLAALMQLQAEHERLQVSLVQAQSRERVAEQRAVDAEQACAELQARISGMRAQQHAATLQADERGASNAAASKWKLKVEDLEQELHSSQQMAARYKARMLLAQEECAGLEEALQHERAGAGRLRQQLTALQQEAAWDEPPKRAPSTSGTPRASTAADVVGFGHVQAQQQLRKLQQQVLKQQELNNELLEEHRALGHKAGALRATVDGLEEHSAQLQRELDKRTRDLETVCRKEADARLAGLTVQEQQAQMAVASLQQQHQAAAARLIELDRATAEANLRVEHLQRVAQQLSAAPSAAAVARQRLVAAAQAAVATQTDEATNPGTPAAGSAVLAAAVASEAAEAIERLQAKVREAQQAQLLAEEAAARSARQLQLCQTELTTVKATANMHEANVQQLQQAVQQLQLRRQTQQAHDVVVAPSSTTANATQRFDRRGTQADAVPSSPTTRARQLQSDPVQSGGAATPATGGLVLVATGASASPRMVARWEVTQQELAASRRELHELQLQVAVAAAEESRLKAAVGELRKQHALAKHDVVAVEDRVAEAQGLADALQKARSQRDAVLVQIDDLQEQITALQQQLRSAQADVAESQHQANLSALKLRHGEEQAEAAQQQVAADAVRRVQDLKSAKSLVEERLAQAQQQAAASAAEHASQLAQRAAEAAEHQARAEVLAADLAKLQADSLHHEAQARAAQQALEGVRHDFEGQREQVRAAMEAAAQECERAAALERDAHAHGQECNQLSKLLAAAQEAAAKAQQRASTVEVALAAANAQLNDALCRLAAAEAAAAKELATAASQTADGAGHKDASLQTEGLDVFVSSPAAKALPEQQQQCDVLRQQVKGFQSQHDALQAQCGELQLMLMAAQQAATVEHQQRQAAHQAELASMHDSLASWETRCTAAEEQLPALQAKVVALEAQSMETGRQLAAERERIEALQLQYTAAKQQLDAAEASMAVVEEQGAASAQQLAAAKDCETALHEQLAAGHEREAALEARCAAAEQELAAVLEDMAVFKARCIAAEEQRQAAEAQLEAGRQTLVTSEMQRTTAEQQLAVVREQEPLLTDLLTSLEQRLAGSAEHEARLAASEQELAELRQQHVLLQQRLMEAAEAVALLDERLQEAAEEKVGLEEEADRLQQVAREAMALLQAYHDGQVQARLEAHDAGQVGPLARPPAVVQHAACQAEFPPAAALEPACQAAAAGVATQDSYVTSSTKKLGTGQQRQGMEAAGDPVASGSGLPYASRRSSRDHGVSPREQDAAAGALATVAAHAQQHELLLQALADKASLEQHAAMLQAQLHEASELRAALERAVGSLEAQVLDLHGEQEQQLILMQSQIESLRSQLVAGWRADEAAATAAKSVATSPAPPAAANTGIASPFGSPASADPEAAPMGSATARQAPESPRLITKAARLEGQLQAAQSAATDMQAHVDRLQARVLQLTAQLQHAERDAAQSQRSAGAARQDFSGLSTQLTAAREAEQQVKHALQEALAVQGEHAAKVQELQARLAAEEPHRAVLEAQLAELQSQLHNAHTDVARLEHEMAAVKQQLLAQLQEACHAEQQANNAIEQSTEEQRSLGAQLQQLQARVAAEERQRCDLEALLEQLQVKLQRADLDGVQSQHKAAAAQQQFLELSARLKDAQDGEQQARQALQQALDERAALDSQAQQLQARGATEALHRASLEAHIQQLQAQVLKLQAGGRARVQQVRDSAMQTEPGAPLPTPHALCHRHTQTDEGYAALQEQLAGAQQRAEILQQQYNQACKELAECRASLTAMDQKQVQLLSAVLHEQQQLEQQLTQQLDASCQELRRCRGELAESQLQAEAAAKEAAAARLQIDALQARLLALEREEQQRQAKAGTPGSSVATCAAPRAMLRHHAQTQTPGTRDASIRRDAAMQTDVHGSNGASIRHDAAVQTQRPPRPLTAYTQTPYEWRPEAQQQRLEELLRAELATAEAQLQRAERELEAYAQEQTQLRAQVATTKQQLAATKQDLARAEAELQGAKAQVSLAQADTEAAVQRQACADAKLLDAAKQQLRHSLAQLQALEQQLQEARASSAAGATTSATAAPSQALCSTAECSAQTDAVSQLLQQPQRPRSLCTATSAATQTSPARPCRNEPSSSTALNELAQPPQPTLAPLPQLRSAPPQEQLEHVSQQPVRPHLLRAQPALHTVGRRQAGGLQAAGALASSLAQHLADDEELGGLAGSLEQLGDEYAVLQQLLQRLTAGMQLPSQQLPAGTGAGMPPRQHGPAQPRAAGIARLGMPTAARRAGVSSEEEDEDVRAGINHDDDEAGQLTDSSGGHSRREYNAASTSDIEPATFLRTPPLDAHWLPQESTATPRSRRSGSTASRARRRQPAGALAAVAVACQTDTLPASFPALTTSTQLAVATSQLQQLQAQHTGLLKETAALKFQASELQAATAMAEARVSDLTAREQLLSATCARITAMLNEQMRSLGADVETHSACCRTVVEEAQQECEWLRDLRAGLLASVSEAKHALRCTVDGLRLAKHAHAAQATLQAAAEALPCVAGVEAQAMQQWQQHAQTVLSRMGAMCGVADALEAKLHDVQVAAASLEQQQQPVAATQQQQHQEAACAAAADSGSDVPLARQLAAVRKALKRAFLALHARAKEFRQQLVEVHQKGDDTAAAFQQLWTGVEEQLGKVLRLTCSSTAPAAALQQPANAAHQGKPPAAEPLEPQASAGSALFAAVLEAANRQRCGSGGSVQSLEPADSPPCSKQASPTGAVNTATRLSLLQEGQRRLQPAGRTPAHLQVAPAAGAAINAQQLQSEPVAALAAAGDVRRAPLGGIENQLQRSPARAAAPTHAHAAWAAACADAKAACHAGSSSANGGQVPALRPCGSSKPSSRTPSLSGGGSSAADVNDRLQHVLQLAKTLQSRAAGPAAAAAAAARAPALLGAGIGGQPQHSQGGRLPFS